MVNLITLRANSADNKLMIFFSYFFQKTVLDMLSPFALNVRFPFPGKNKKKYFKISSAESYTQNAKC